MIESGGGDKKGIVIIIILTLVLANIVHGIMSESTNRIQWIERECHIMLLSYFQGTGLEGIEDAERLVNSTLAPDSISEGKFMYCSGYDILSNSTEYFLCNDGRLYQIMSCKKGKENYTDTSLLPFSLPSFG